MVNSCYYSKGCTAEIRLFYSPRLGRFFKPLSVLVYLQL